MRREEIMDEHEAARMERERRAPYEGKGLGDLVNEMMRLAMSNPYVVGEEDQVPQGGQQTYKIISAKALDFSPGMKRYFGYSR